MRLSRPSHSVSSKRVALSVFHVSGLGVRRVGRVDNGRNGFALSGSLLGVQKPENLVTVLRM